MLANVVNVWDALVLGIVEGITEFLPISSTGHLVLASEILGLRNEQTHTAEQIAAVQAFEIVIQSGAILAVLIIYRKEIFEVIQGVLGKSERGLRLFINMAIAAFPALAVGYLTKNFISAHLQFLGPVLAAMAVGGLAMLVFEYWYGRKPQVSEGKGLDELSPRQALLVGCIQCFALWPGMSRSMVTIVGGMSVGLRRTAAAEFSFLVGLPTLLIATGYKGLKDGKLLFEYIGGASMAVGLISATVFAALAVTWLVNFLNRRGLAVFGWYRLVAAALMFFFLYKS